MTHSLGGVDWQTNSRSGLSRSPLMKTHETKGVPGARPAGAGGRVAQPETMRQPAMSTIDKSRLGIVRSVFLDRIFRLKPEATKTDKATLLKLIRQPLARACSTKRQ